MDRVRKQFLRDNSIEEKNEILSGYDSSNEKGEGLSLHNLVYSYVIIAVAIVLFIPTIYIRNEIYYISRDIDVLRNKHSVLLEENKNLERNIEKLKFKYEIIDPLLIEIQDES